MPLLEVRKITKRFGGLVAIDELDFTIEGGEIVGLIGPNGAGKTTLFNVLSGFLSPTRGRVFFDRVDITGWKPHRVSEKGLVRTFQQNLLVSEMTALQNVVLACHLSSRVNLWGVLFNTRSRRENEQRSIREASEILTLVGLGEVSNELAKNLPHGYQRMLGIGVALAARPRLLMLDEPATGLNAVEMSRQMGIIRQIRDMGTTILLVEHQMQAVMNTCERICVLNFGKKIAEGTPSEIAANDTVIEAYLGAEYAAKRKKPDGQIR
jgi:branched-chain amino acid transport system ATP-binding protein